MDKDAKKLVESLKTLVNELDELAYKCRDARDRCPAESYWYGYYDGKAESLEDAHEMIGKRISEWAESLLAEVGKSEGMEKTIETESTTEKTFVFEVCYDAEGVCRSEELVGWYHGKHDRNADKKFGDRKHYKAVYN